MSDVFFTCFPTWSSLAEVADWPEHCRDPRLLLSTETASMHHFVGFS